MYGELDLLGLESAIGTILLIATIGGILLTVLGIIYAVRSWMAQTAALETRKDVAEIKRQLEAMNRPVTPPVQSTTPDRREIINDGPKIASSPKP